MGLQSALEEVFKLKFFMKMNEIGNGEEKILVGVPFFENLYAPIPFVFLSF